MAIMSTAAPVVPAGTYTVDPAHSRVGFSVRHLGVATTKGSFDAFGGVLQINGSDLSTARASGTVDVASIDTDDETRDENLRSASIFDVEHHPTIAFTSTAIRRTGPSAFEIAGDLTMRGITKDVTLRAEVRSAETDASGRQRVRLDISGSLNRSDYGIKFEQAGGSGNALVSKEVKLSLDISAVRS